MFVNIDDRLLRAGLVRKQNEFTIQPFCLRPYCSAAGKDAMVSIRHYYRGMLVRSEKKPGGNVAHNFYYLKR
jgi:hypothetical protein